MNRNTFVLLAAVSSLTLVLGFAYGATFNGGCSEIKDAPFGCAEYLLSRYQTLIAMFGAVFVGVYAVRPVFKQLRLSGVQTNITLHHVHTAREKLLVSRAKSELDVLDKFSIDLNQGYDLRAREAGVLSHWVWDMNQEVDRVQSRLVQRQAENLDGDETTIERQNLINALKRLSDCMYDYNGQVYLDRSEDEVTPELEARVVAAEANAVEDLPILIGEATEAINSLRQAFDAELGEIRLKRQFIDQVLANVDIASERSSS